jgi:hypothetical protein
MRFCFHPLRDKFVLINSWKDPSWTDVKIIRAGIDGDEKEKRELVFGKNLIDIQEKSVLQLLVDEVGLNASSTVLSADTSRLFIHFISFRLRV